MQQVSCGKIALQSKELESLGENQARPCTADSPVRHARSRLEADVVGVFSLF